MHHRSKDLGEVEAEDGDGSGVTGRETVAGISDNEVVVAILAHLGLPPFAPPIARARSAGFDFT